MKRMTGLEYYRMLRPGYLRERKGLTRTWRRVKLRSLWWWKWGFDGLVGRPGGGGPAPAPRR